MTFSVHPIVFAFPIMIILIYLGTRNWRAISSSIRTIDITLIQRSLIRHLSVLSLATIYICSLLSFVAMTFVATFAYLLILFILPTHVLASFAGAALSILTFIFMFTAFVSTFTDCIPTIIFHAAVVSLISLVTYSFMMRISALSVSVVACVAISIVAELLIYNYVPSGQFIPSIQSAGDPSFIHMPGLVSILRYPLIAGAMLSAFVQPLVRRCILRIGAQTL